MCIPFLNWFVWTCSAIAGARLSDGHELLREAGEDLGVIPGDDDEILDANAALARDVDPRLDRDHVSRLERVLRLGPEHRRLVDEDAEPVAEAVAEPFA